MCRSPPLGALTVDTSLGRFNLRACTVARRSRATRRSASRRGSARLRTPRPRFARAHARARRGEFVDLAVVVVVVGSRPPPRRGSTSHPPPNKYRGKPDGIRTRVGSFRLLRRRRATRTVCPRCRRLRRRANRIARRRRARGLSPASRATISHLPLLSARNAPPSSPTRFYALAPNNALAPEQILDAQVRCFFSCYVKRFLLLL